MRHRAYVRKIHGFDQWVSIIVEVDGPYRNFRGAVVDKKFHYAVAHAHRYARLLDELRGIFPDGDGSPTISPLPRHCLWCGVLLDNDKPWGQLTCDAPFHGNKNNQSYGKRTYRPELCEHPEKRKFVYRGTAMFVARQLNPNEGDCYECGCGTFHLTRSDGIFALMEQCSKPARRPRNALRNTP